MEITLGPQYNVGEKPTVILYIYINRHAGSTVAESPVVLYRVGTHQIRRRRRAARSSTSQGRAEPLCARITGLNREVSEGKADDV